MLDVIQERLLPRRVLLRAARSFQTGEQTMISVEEKEDVYPICPHCAKETDIPTAEEIRQMQRELNFYYEEIYDLVTKGAYSEDNGVKSVLEYRHDIVSERIDKIEEKLGYRGGVA